MNPLVLFPLAAAFALGSSNALAQDRYSRDGGARNPEFPRSYSRDGSYRDGGHHQHDHRWARPHYYSRYYPRTFVPYIYPAPLFGYEPYPFYVPAPAPVYVERYRVYEEDLPPPPAPCRGG